MYSSLRNYKKATFGGGCFWCMHAVFKIQKGVIDVVSGFAGGKEINPTYEQVSRGDTGHYESIQITYDPEKIDYTKLLEIFWHNIDPTDAGGQFADRGSQYETVIFYHNPEQKTIAEQSKNELDFSGKFKGSIATQILPFDQFFEAEDYHQDYADKNPLRYDLYKKGSGREKKLEIIWKN